MWTFVKWAIALPLALVLLSIFFMTGATFLSAYGYTIHTPATFYLLLPVWPIAVMLLMLICSPVTFFLIVIPIAISIGGGLAMRNGYSRL